MTGSHIFEFKDYKKFIITWIEQGPQKGHGQRKLLAEAMDCQTAYVSHVLNGSNHLSLEQAEKCAKWMGLDSEETEYLILLVLAQRAGTKSLEKIFNNQITVYRDKNMDLKKRVESGESLSLEMQKTYYSHWHYSAIHMALNIPHLQVLEALQNHFQIPLSRLNEVLHFLLSSRLIKKDKERFVILKPFLHLDKQSELIVRHHINWRSRAIDALLVNSHRDLHYSGVMTLSRDDYEWVREKLASTLEDIFAKIKTSEDETIATFCFDFFET